MGNKEGGLLLTAVMLVLTFDRANCNTQEIGNVVSIRSNSVTHLKDSESLLHRDSRSVHHRSRRALTSVEMQQALDTHNRVRASVGASDMEIMVWNDILSTMAYDWAITCQWKHGQADPIPSSLLYTSLGQNLYAISGASFINITAALMEWFNEYQYYNYDTQGCQAGQQCGHYTQMAWASSQQLGCAYANCSTLALSNLTSPALYLVCNYGPPGNVVGQKPFQMGRPCSKCASGAWWCNSGLCTKTCTAVGPTCACTPMCQNSGLVNGDSCSCSCAPGWYGSDCSAVCADQDARCDPAPGQSGYPPSYCTDSQYQAQIRVKCPKMCNVCQASSTSSSSYITTKSSLLSMLAVWLFCLLLCCRSI